MICMIVFCLCAIMQIIISSFKIAIDHINDSDLEELQKGDPAKAGCLERYHSDDHLLVISSSFLRIFSVLWKPYGRSSRSARALISSSRSPICRRYPGMLPAFSSIQSSAISIFSRLDKSI